MLYQQDAFRAAAGATFRPGGLELSAEMARSCGLTSGMHVLDLGCGVGSTASYLAQEWGVDTVGVDSSADFLEEARGRDPRVTWLLGRAEEIPCETGTFDAVFCECFLSIVDEPERVLAEIRRVLKPGGYLALADMYLRLPEVAPPRGSLSAAACLCGAVGRTDVLSLVAGAGFALETWEDRSDPLKSLMASLIFSYGSAEAFWRAAAGPDGGCGGSLARARPGYYFLVARSVGDGDV